jgi:hypothetical protein
MGGILVITKIALKCPILHLVTIKCTGKNISVLIIKNSLFSFDLGPVHFVGISTEYHGFFHKYGHEPVLNQHKWLQENLIVPFSTCLNFKALF